MPQMMLAPLFNILLLLQHGQGLFLESVNESSNEFVVTIEVIELLNKSPHFWLQDIEVLLISGDNLLKKLDSIPSVFMDDILTRFALLNSNISFELDGLSLSHHSDIYIQYLAWFDKYFVQKNI